MFVRFDCGCIGIDAVGAHTRVCIKPCDAERDDPTVMFYQRDLTDKTVERHLTPKECRELVEEVGSLVADGHRMREVRALIGAFS